MAELKIAVLDRSDDELRGGDPMGDGIEGRRVLVTGASAGIGAAIATGMAERGAIVGICARRENRLRDVLADCQASSPESRMWVVDLADLDEIQDFAHRADDELGGIDVLVNNAGIPKRRRVEALTADEVDAVMAINYLSPVRLILALLPRMLQRATERGHHGQVVSISSVAARLSPPGEAAYAASKAALTAWSECLAAELWNQPVDVHVINPGVIDTDLFTLPDNDPPIAGDIEALPPSTVLDALLGQLESGTFEVFVPDWFKDVFVLKAGDVDGFLEGAALYAEQQTEPGRVTRPEARD